MTIRTLTLHANATSLDAQFHEPILSGESLASLLREVINSARFTANAPVPTRNMPVAKGYATNDIFNFLAQMHPEYSGLKRRELSLILKGFLFRERKMIEARSVLLDEERLAKLRERAAHETNATLRAYLAEEYAVLAYRLETQKEK